MSFEIMPDEALIRDALINGWAKKTVVGFTELGEPDRSLQARVIHLNPVHVEKLRESLRDGSNLRPVAIFREDNPKKLWLADGFHRHEAYKLEGRHELPAYVIEGGYREALKFATMCNRDNCLKRTNEDEKKAAHMLFAEEEWWCKANTAISSHVGVSHATIRRWRDAYAAEHKLKIPSETIDKNGRRYPRVRTTYGLPKKTKDGRYVKTIEKKTYFLGRDKEAAEERLGKILEGVPEKVDKTITCPRCRGKGFIHK